MKPIDPLVISRAIEVQGEWGQIIALPKAYVAFNAIRKIISEKNFNEIIHSNKSSEEIIDELFELFSKKLLNIKNCPENMQAQEYRIAKEIFAAININNKGNPSFEQDDLINKLRQVLDFQINLQNVLNELKNDEDYIKKIISEDVYKKIINQKDKNVKEIIQDVYHAFSLKFSKDIKDSIGLNKKELYKGMLLYNSITNIDFKKSFSSKNDLMDTIQKSLEQDILAEKLR